MNEIIYLINFFFRKYSFNKSYNTSIIVNHINNSLNKIGCVF